MGQSLLQAGATLFQNGAVKHYCKVGQLFVIKRWDRYSLQSGAISLQSSGGIAECVNYYKAGKHISVNIKKLTRSFDYLFHSCLSKPKPSGHR